LLPIAAMTLGALVLLVGWASRPVALGGPRR